MAVTEATQIAHMSFWISKDLRPKSLQTRLSAALFVPRIKHTNFLAAVRDRIKNKDDTV